MLNFINISYLIYYVINMIQPRYVIHRIDPNTMSAISANRTKNTKDCNRSVKLELCTCTPHRNTVD